MNKREGIDVRQSAEQHFEEAPANLNECICSAEHNLQVALSEQRGTPSLFAPAHRGLKNSYCETFGRCRWAK